MTLKVLRSIYKFSRKVKDVVPCRLTKLFFKRHVTLLLLYRRPLPKQQRTRFAAHIHFAVIYNNSLFFAAKAKHFLGKCRFCAECFKDENHELYCGKSNPQTNSVKKEPHYRYKEYFRTVHVPYFMVFDLLYINRDDNLGLRVAGFGLVILSSDKKKYIPGFI